ncbi:MAG: serine hydrolase [Flavobacteriaceae bacterium]|nr:serine hydrolase [Flavobacteriaceae bacterium]
MKAHHFKTLLANLIPLMLLPVLILGCKSYSENPYNYRIPEQVEDGITVGTLSDAGIDTSLIQEAVTRIRNGAYGAVHSILIYRKGKLVLEEYFPGYTYKWDAPAHQGQWVNFDKDRPHSIMSDTKSITSTCIGIAIEKGFIESVDQSIFDYLPDHQHLKTDGKDKISIEHLLTMTPGLEWYEWNAPYSSNKNPIIGIWFSDKDPVSFILEGELRYEPGTHYSYYGGNQILLGEIIRHATSMAIDEFSQKYLFDPLGIDSADWNVRFPNGVIEAAGGLLLKPRDMLKVGVTYLEDGRWNGQQILTKDWIEKSAMPYPANLSIKVPGEDYGRSGYSYSWWTKTFTEAGKENNIYWAGGWGGQKIIVMPDHEAAVVFTGGNYTSKVRQFGVIGDYILPAFK